MNTVFDSDSILGDGLCEALLEALKPLEDVPEADKDYHPGTNNQVFYLCCSLTSFSLFCFPTAWGACLVHKSWGLVAGNTANPCSDSTYDTSR